MEKLIVVKLEDIQWSLKVCESSGVFNINMMEDDNRFSHVVEMQIQQRYNVLLGQGQIITDILCLVFIKHHALQYCQMSLFWFCL